MNLEAIETVVLQNIGFKVYSELSVSTDTLDTEYFAVLHKCVLLARETIKSKCYLPCILKHTAAVSTVVGVSRYNFTETDVDIITDIKYKTATTDYKLVRKTKDTIYKVVAKSTTAGTPVYYVVFGATPANLPRVEIHPVPTTAAEELTADYIPVLTELTTSTDEDVIMLKYPETVIKMASAYAFRIMKADSENFNLWQGYATIDFKEINQRELGFEYELPMPKEKVAADNIITLQIKKELKYDASKY